MKIVNVELEKVLLIKLDVFEDHRGEFVETYNKNLYSDNGINIDFVQDDISVSTKNVLRGIHGDEKTWKLISCLYGSLYFVVVNCDESSDSYGKWKSFVLSDVNRCQVLVPPKFGNGYLALSDKVIFNYKQSEYYNSKIQFTYKWDDPNFNIWWPVKAPITSIRDECGHYV